MLKKIIEGTNNFFNKSNKNDLNKIFYPKSIAVIGASNDTSKIGGFIFSQILKNQNIKVFPINIKWKEIQGKKSYPSVLEIPKNENIELAIIAIPSKFVLDAVMMCSKRSIKNIVIISAGFKEASEEGKKREEELKKIISENEINLIGPNCLGFLNPEINLNCSFAKDIPNFGEIALVSQSGAVIDAIIDWSFEKNIGFSKIISVGNMAGLSEIDFLKYLKNDPKTKIICYYMETLERGEEFSKILLDISKEKKVIIIKPGNSKEAQKAIGSHTGSLAQNNELVKTLINENNGIIVEDLRELFNLLIGSSRTKKFKSKKIAVVTNAGGLGVITTDAISKYSFELFNLSEEEKSKFDFLPKEASLNNPIDILGDAKSDRYKKTLETLNNIDGFENIIVLLTPQIMTDANTIAEEIIRISSTSNKNIFVCFLGGKEVKKGIQILNNNKIATFSTPSEIVETLSKLHNYFSFEYDDIKREDVYSQIYNRLNKDKINEIKTKIKNKNGMLEYNLVKEIFDLLAIKVPNKEIILELEDIEKKKNLIQEGKEYVLKIDSPNAIHKKEIGGVIIGVNKENFEEKAHHLFSLGLENFEDFNITIEEKVKEGVEVIVGLKDEKDLGQFIMFGWGGTYTNILKDVKFAQVPIRKSDAKRLVESTKVFNLLNGFRGTKKINFEHLYEILIRVSILQRLFPEIKEVDLNPIIFNEEGIFLVDIKLIV
jgi:acetyltransferase